MEPTYKEKLRDERWQEKRAFLFKKAGDKCESCGKGQPLAIHHGYYRFSTNPWDYENSSLWVLCWPCHEEAQILLASIHQAIGHIHPLQLPDLKSRVSDATFEATFGMTQEEMNEFLEEDRVLQRTLYAPYSAEIISCSDLGMSVADEIEKLAEREFPGLQIDVVESESSPDAVSTVVGPDPAVVSRIQRFLDRTREKLG